MILNLKSHFRMDRIIHIKDEQARTMAIKLLNSLPLGGLDLIIRPHKEVRSPSQNSLMWASANADIAKQAFMNGKQYGEQVWHGYFKEQFMPDVSRPDLTLLVKNPDTYVKWVETPAGLRCVASTTNLTKKGFSDYMEQIYSLGAELGVQFSSVQR